MLQALYESVFDAATCQKNRRAIAATAFIQKLCRRDDRAGEVKARQPTVDDDRRSEIEAGDALERDVASAIDGSAAAEPPGVLPELPPGLVWAADAAAAENAALAGLSSSSGPSCSSAPPPLPPAEDEPLVSKEDRKALPWAKIPGHQDLPFTTRDGIKTKPPKAGHNVKQAAKKYAEQKKIQLGYFGSPWAKGTKITANAKCCGPCAAGKGRQYSFEGRWAIDAGPAAGEASTFLLSVSSKGVYSHLVWTHGLMWGDMMDLSLQPCDRDLATRGCLRGENLATTAVAETLRRTTTCQGAVIISGEEGLEGFCGKEGTKTKHEAGTV